MRPFVLSLRPNQLGRVWWQVVGTQSNALVELQKIYKTLLTSSFHVNYETLESLQNCGYGLGNQRRTGKPR